MAGWADNEAYDLAGLNAQKHRIDDAWTTGMAKNTYQKGVAGLGHLDQLAKLRMGQTRSEGSWRSGWAQRGLRNSGIYGESMNNRLQDAQTAETDVNRNYLMHVAGLQGDARALDLSKWTGTADVNALKQATKNRVAASIGPS